MTKFVVQLEAIAYQVLLVEVEADTLAQAVERAVEIGENTPQGWEVTETEKIRAISARDPNGVEVSYEDMKKSEVTIDTTSIADDPAAAQAIYGQLILENKTPPASKDLSTGCQEDRCPICGKTGEHLCRL
jgi:hypothetical protein